MPALIPAGASILGGGLQSIFGAINARKDRSALERLQTPRYQESKAIGDYYQQALNRYNVSPFNSSLYQQQQQQANRALGTGIAGLQTRRNAIGGVSALTQGYNDNLQNAGVKAEAMKGQQFQQLGQASRLQQQEDQKSFQYNQLLPFQKQYSILGSKLSGANQLLNSGLSNLYAGLGAGSSIENSFQQQGRNFGGGYDTGGGGGGGNQNAYGSGLGGMLGLATQYAGLALGG